MLSYQILKITLGGIYCYTTCNGHLQHGLPQTPFALNSFRKSIWFQQKLLDFYVTRSLGPT